MKKNISCGLAAAFLFAFSIAMVGCSGKGLPGTGVKKIRWIVDPAPTRNDEIKGFEKANPDLKVVLSNEYVGNEIILTQIAGDNPPDVFAIYDPATLRSFMKKNALLDLTPYLKKYNIPIDDFWPCLKPYMFYENKIYGIPPNCGAHVLFYNKEIFDKCGVAYPKDNWTWEDVVREGKKLVKKSEKYGIYEHFGLFTDDPFLFIQQNGGRWFTGDGKKCIINSPEAKAGMQYYYDLIFVHNIMPTPEQASEAMGASKGGWGGTMNLFASKRVAMYIQGRWMSIIFRRDKTLNWNVAAVPRGKYKITRLASKIYAIPFNCKNKEEAVRFLAYQISKDNQLMITNSGDGVSSRMSLAKMPEFLHYDGYPEEPRRELYVEEMKYATVADYSPYVTQIETERIWTEEFEKMANKLQSVNDTLDKIAKRTNDIINKNLPK